MTDHGHTSSATQVLIHCVTEGHEHLRATRRLRLFDSDDAHAYSYCDECADLLLRTNMAEDAGPSEDPVVVERDRYKEALRQWMPHDHSAQMGPGFPVNGCERCAWESRGWL